MIIRSSQASVVLADQSAVALSAMQELGGSCSAASINPHSDILRQDGTEPVDLDQSRGSLRRTTLPDRE
jgi:hypothetical protein